MNSTLNDVMKSLKANRDKLTRQQLRTLKGQALAGDTAGAMKGLQKILKQGK